MSHHPPTCHWCDGPGNGGYATGLDGYHHLTCGGSECGFDLWTRQAA